VSERRPRFSIVRVLVAWNSCGFHCGFTAGATDRGQVVDLTHRLAMPMAFR